LISKFLTELSHSSPLRGTFSSFSLLSRIQVNMFSTSAETTHWLAPAKINLFLHIVGRRADGYHNLETIFQFLDFADELTFRVRNDGKTQRIVGSTADLAHVPAGDDLTVRAAEALKAEIGTPLGADISITKRIPMGGGLGGGSSDAATVLVGLNQVWNLGLDTERLAEIGLTLGADVPVFVRGQAAFASGVGERLLPVVLEEPWYLVIHPGCSVPTAAVFNAQDLTRDTSPIKIHTLFQGESDDGRLALSSSQLSTWLRNDCEPVVRSQYPPVDAAFTWLSQFANPRMAGTGACLFAPFPDRQAAERVLAMLSEREQTGMEDDWSGFIARGRNRSSLMDSLSHAKGMGGWV